MNLRHLVVETARSSASVEYQDIADAVLAQIDSHSMRAALAQALPTFVAQVVKSQREPWRIIPPSASSSESSTPTSWKVQGIREWQKRLTEVYASGEGNKRLGDFTYDNLVYLADATELDARRGLARAQGWRDCADLLKEHDVDTVSELPAEVLAAMFGAVA